MPSTVPLPSGLPARPCSSRRQLVPPRKKETIRLSALIQEPAGCEAQRAPASVAPRGSQHRGATEWAAPWGASGTACSHSAQRQSSPLRNGRIRWLDRSGGSNALPPPLRAILDCWHCMRLPCRDLGCWEGNCFFLAEQSKESTTSGSHLGAAGPYRAAQCVLHSAPSTSSCRHTAQEWWARHAPAPLLGRFL